MTCALLHLIRASFLLLAVGSSADHVFANPSGMSFISLSDDGKHFVKQDSGKRFNPWGFNYDHRQDLDGALLEDYWHEHWEMVVDDFKKMKSLGANAVRIHLQFGRFMNTPTEPNPENLDQLSRLIDLAEEVGLYINLTGLGCYHREGVPDWYDALSEPERWAAQARFWEAVAAVCADSPAIFCYNLMNEPL